MAWVTLTEALLSHHMSGPELTAFKTAALKSGQADPVAAMLAEVATLVRGYVGAAGIALGTAPTVPDELQNAALDVCRWKVLTRLPGVSMLQDDARKSAYEEALKLFRDVQAGKFSIVPALTEAPEEEQPGPVLPTFSGRDKTFTL